MVTSGEITSIVGLLNGMLGGTILVLPLLGQKTGYLLIPLIALFYGTFSGYCTYLLVLHLGHAHSIRASVLEHFHGSKKYSIIYNIIIICAQLGFLISYFQLMIKQIEGFFHPSPWIPIFALCFILVLTSIMRKFDIGDKLLAYGIISIIGYIIFLFWAQVTAPSGKNSVPPVAPQFIDLAAALIMGFSVQSFVDQVLLKNTTPDKYARCVLIMTIGGILAYIFISFGCFAIVNRDPRIPTPQTVEEYFPFGSWQVGLIQVLYFIHLISAIPQFFIVLKIRFFQIFSVEEQEEISPWEILFMFVVYGLIFCIYITKVKIATIIELNGSVIGFCYVLLFPIIIHLKCVYFNKRDENGVMITEMRDDKGELEAIEGECKCQVTYMNNFTKYLELICLIAALIVGLLTVVYTLYTLFNQSETASSTSTNSHDL